MATFTFSLSHWLSNEMCDGFYGCERELQNRHYDSSAVDLLRIVFVLVILICNNFIILLKKNEVARVVVFKVNEGFK